MSAEWKWCEKITSCCHFIDNIVVELIIRTLMNKERCRLFAEYMFGLCPPLSCLLSHLQPACGFGSVSWTKREGVPTDILSNVNQKREKQRKKRQWKRKQIVKNRKLLWLVCIFELLLFMLGKYRKYQCLCWRWCCKVKLKKTYMKNRYSENVSFGSLPLSLSSHVCPPDFPLCKIFYFFVLNMNCEHKQNILNHKFS